MIWYLLICGHVYSGQTCNAPQQVPTRHVCEILAREVPKTSDARGWQGYMTARCVGVRP